MTSPARAALRSLGLTLGLVASIGLVSADAWAAPKVPLPKPRPIARNVVPKGKPDPVKQDAPQATAAIKPTAPVAPAPVLAPATRQHAAPRKPVTPHRNPLETTRDRLHEANRPPQRERPGGTDGDHSKGRRPLAQAGRGGDSPDRQ